MAITRSRPGGSIRRGKELRNSGARPGDLVAIQGIGGLGHLGIQCARRMGFRTVAIGRGGDKEPLARKLGAHEYIDTTRALRPKPSRSSEVRA